MKIVVDENIEFGQEAFQQFGDVSLVHGRKITNETLKDAEILIVRSITNVNEQLLKGTPVKFVGSTTIGTDHFDTDYLNSANIKFVSAPGCNSFAVSEYVLTAILGLSNEYDFGVQDKSLGVIGYGNIGKKITHFAKTLGMSVLVNDPPLQRDGYDYNFSSFDEVLKCDIITAHVPMLKSGVDKTFHLLGNKVIDSLTPHTILINSSRGAVVDNSALLKRLNVKEDLMVVLDVWENEPFINRELLGKVQLGTPHIAGYTYEGKVNGTVMIYSELCDFLGADNSWRPILTPVTNNTIQPNQDDDLAELLFGITNKIYSIENDSIKMKEKSNMSDDSFGEYFGQLRKEYKLRREFSNYIISSDNLSPYQISVLKQLRFNIS